MKVDKRDTFQGKGRDTLVTWSKGNPGALHFLLSVFFNPDVTLEQALIIHKKLMACESIRGTNLHVLNSDLCDKDLDKVVQLCKTCPDHILEDACNRQDYSGQELVKEYLI